jgi:assimilatory nitrate reductase catalytic subunit
MACGADVLLPAAAWGEKDGTVTNSERRISRQRAFLPLPGEAKPDWWIVAQVAQRMGFADAFDYQSAADVFREHAALSAFENDGSRDFDIGALAGLDDDAFNALDPVQWPARAGDAPGETRFFADGRFFTPDGRARLIAPEPPAPRSATSEAFPLVLNTGRIRDQWHTMTRSGLSPRLGAHLPEPFVEVHPIDAAAAGLRDGGFARVNTAYGACVLKVIVSAGQRRGSLFAPIHWSGETAASARVGALVAPITDPFSGQPEAKATPAAIAPVDYALRGFALSRQKLALPDGNWWARIAVRHGAGVLFASNEPAAAWRDSARTLFGDGVELAEYLDEPRQSFRVAAFEDGRLVGSLFVGPADAVPQWDAVKVLFEADALEDRERRAVLSGQSTSGLPDAGPIVCACFGVGLNTIRDAITSGEAESVEAIGKSLRAGTNCGSCLPEVRKIVAGTKVNETA